MEREGDGGNRNSGGGVSMANQYSMGGSPFAFHSVSALYLFCKMTRSHACLSVPLHQTNNGDAQSATFWRRRREFPEFRYNMLHAQNPTGETKTKRGTFLYLDGKDTARLGDGTSRPEKRNKQNDRLIIFYSADEITRRNGEGDTRKFRNLFSYFYFVFFFLGFSTKRVDLEICISFEEGKKPVVRKTDRIHTDRGF